MSHNFPPPAGIIIESLGGNCPVQATGTIDGELFYFRARGAHWSIEIGPGNTDQQVREMDRVRNGAINGPADAEREAMDSVEALGYWRYEEEYGDWPEAGWMAEDEARAFIVIAAFKWRESRRVPEKVPDRRVASHE